MKFFHTQSPVCSTWKLLIPCLLTIDLELQCENILPGGSREQQDAPALEAIPRNQFRPVLRGTQAGPKISECANTSLHKLPLLSLTCPNQHHSNKSHCQGRWQEEVGGRDNKLYTHRWGGGSSLALTQLVFQVQKSCALRSFASFHVLNAYSRRKMYPESVK